MPDQPTDDAPAVPQTGPYIHMCCTPGCTAWGSFGHQEGRETRWHCRVHDPASGRGSEGLRRS